MTPWAPSAEAFADYYRHLTDEGGLLIMAHNMPEAIRITASVIGSALAIMIAFSAGYAWSLVFGAACYLAAALFMYSYVAHAPASTRLARCGHRSFRRSAL